MAAEQPTSELKAAFERFIEKTTATSRFKSLSSSEREKLLTQFMKYLELQEKGQ